MDFMLLKCWFLKKEELIQQKLHIFFQSCSITQSCSILHESGDCVTPAMKSSHQLQCLYDCRYEHQMWKRQDGS